MRTKTRAIVAGGAVAAVVGGLVVFQATQATAVTLVEDGASRTVHTRADTVAGALQTAKVEIASHDLVTPLPTSHIGGKTTIVVKHGRPVTVTVDGVKRTLWVTATTVDDALAQLRLRTQGAVLSVSRSASVPRSGLALSVNLPHRVTVLADGHTVALVSTGPTVADALRSARVAVRPQDRVAPAASTRLTGDVTVRVTRIDDRQVTVTEPVGYGTVRKADAGLTKGTSRTITAGRAGTARVVYAVHLVDGRQTGRTLVSRTVLTAPTSAVVAYGTRSAPTSTSGSGGSSGRAAPPPPSSGGLNWAAVARCESGGNPRAVSASGTYRGLYQFSLATWHSVGGVGDPIDASVAEQTYRAQLLYNRSGRAPWPVCGRYL